MTHTRRIEKLEAQVASLRRRLDARTTQLITLLDQLAAIKDTLASEHNIVLELQPVEDETPPCSTR